MRSKMTANGWPGRAPEGGVAWAVLAEVFVYHLGSNIIEYS